MRIVLVLLLFSLWPLVQLIGQEAGPGSVKPLSAHIVQRPNPDGNGVYHANFEVVAPKLTYSVEPNFTEKARKKKIQGNCLIKLTVSAEGHLENVRVMRSIAEDNPPKLRDAAASMDEESLKAVKQYRFEPATFQGKPVPFEMTVEVNIMIF